MSDAGNAYKQIVSFLNSKTEKTLLICGVADKEKHQVLLKALNDQGPSRGLIYLIHTTKNGMENFFHWADLYKIKTPSKYGQAMQLSNLTICFDKLSPKSNSNKYNDYTFDFIIVWPIQGVTKGSKEVRMLYEMAKRQKTEKIIYLTIREPWYSSEPLKPYVDRIVTLNCENDNPEEYQRTMSAHDEDIAIRQR